MKLYIAYDTCSRAVQLIANELGIEHQLIHVDVKGGSTSSGQDFSAVHSLRYVPVLELENDDDDKISETIVIASYLADLQPEVGLMPPHGTSERVKADQLLVFIATEIAQKHIPLMRKLMTDDGVNYYTNKLLVAYKRLDDQLADGRPYLCGDRLTVPDAYTWATLWNSRSGVNIDHLENLKAWRARVDKRAAVIKTVEDEAAIAAAHQDKISALGKALQ